MGKHTAMFFVLECTLSTLYEGDSFKSPGQVFSIRRQ
jgi:hypothetical protein